MDTKVVRLLEAHKENIARVGMRVGYQTVEHAVRLVLPGRTVNKAIYKKVDSFARLHRFTQRLTSNLVQFALL